VQGSPDGGWSRGTRGFDADPLACQFAINRFDHGRLDSCAADIYPENLHFDFPHNRSMARIVAYPVCSCEKFGRRIGAMHDAFQPVELAKSYLLLNHGPVVLVSSAFHGRRNVMAARG
jgi:hypothetical protein